MDDHIPEEVLTPEGDENLALAKISLELLRERNGYFKKLWVALIISILINLALAFSFLWYESQWEYATTTTTTTQEVEGEGSSINNIQGDQYNDQAIHNEGGE